MGKPKQLRFRAQDRNIFEAVKEGRKTVETRAASPKFSDIKAGDIVVLKCGKERLEKKVRKVRFLKKITEILDYYKIRQIHPDLSSVEELEKMYFGFPGYKEKIKKYGLAAFELG
jgi:ASC-1-like (ASCH) protein